MSESEVNVLYISDFGKPTKRCTSAINNVIGLLKSGINVICRSLNTENVNPVILNCLNKPIKNITHCIQHIDNDLMIGSNMYKKNIGIVECPSIEFKDKELVYRMDELWSYNPLLSSEDFKFCIKPCFKQKEYYKKEYIPMSINELDHTYKFYTIMNYSTNKKYLEDLFVAFYTTFDVYDQVSLLIKARILQNNKEKELFNHINYICESVKHKCGKKNYPKEIILCGNMEDSHIASIHQACDCFINTSIDIGEDYNEIDAIGFGNTYLNTFNDKSLNYPLFGIDSNSYGKRYNIQYLQDFMLNSYKNKTVKEYNYYSIDDLGKDLKRELLK